MHKGKIQEYRERLQQGVPDNEIIKYIGKIDGHYFYLVTYTEFVVVGYPEIIEIDSKNPDVAIPHCNFDLYKQLLDRFPRSFRASRSSK